MIRPIDIRLNAAHPDYPLAEAVTFTGSPSTVLIRGVPPNCGRWAITAVSVAATYPDGSTTTRAAVQSANGVWVATLPATATSGRTANGLRVLASGIDENGEAVTGYVLGVADFAVASLDVTPAPQPGETSYQMLYFDAVPSVLRKGDVAKVDGVLKFYNGEAWEAFATPPTLDDAVTRTSANGVKSSGIWSAIWGTASTAFSSLYDWAVAQLGLKRDYTDLSYDTTETVEVPALHVTMRNNLSWQVIAEYDFLCTEEVPDPPQMGHVYTWRADGAKFYITQGVSALQTTWILYSQNGEVIEDITTQNATQGFYPDVDFIANAAVITTHKTTVQKQVAKEDTIALESKTVPTSRTVNGTPLSSDVALTGADIAVSGTDATKISAALAGKLDKSGGTITGDLTLQSTLIANDVSVVDHLFIDENAPFGFDTSEGGVLQIKPSSPIAAHEDVAVQVPVADGTLALTADIPYTLVTKTISNNAVILDDRAINAVAVSSSLASLTINFPTATSGKARDFGLRLTVASGITTAPQIVLPQGVTCENADGEAPEIGADGAATILYFTETASGVFLVKGEVVTAIS